jgi:hypothetical protein
MPSAVLNEQFYDGGFVVSLAPGDQSIDQGYMDNGTGSDILFQAGLVVVQATSGTAMALPGSNAGNGAIGSVSLGASVQQGAYLVSLISPTSFTVTAPGGAVIGTGNVGTPFAGSQSPSGVIC